MSDYAVYKPEYGAFPPKIRGEIEKIVKTDIDGGTDLEYRDGFLYIISAGNGGELRIYKDENGSVSYVSKIGGLGNTRQIALGNGICAVTARENGAYIIDIKDPYKPEIISYYDTVEFATGVYIDGRYLFFCCRQFGIEAVDISEPDKPAFVCNIVSGEAQSIFVSDCVLYAGEWANRCVSMFDISDILNPKKIGRVDIGGRGDGIYAENGILYAAFGQHKRGMKAEIPSDECYGRGNGFGIYDVTNPEKPVTVSETFFEHRYYYSGHDMWKVTKSGKYIIVSHTFNGVYIYDIENPETPVLKAHIAIETENRDIIQITERIIKFRPPMFSFDIDKIRYAPVYSVCVTDGKVYILPLGEKLHIAYSDEYFKENKAPDTDKAPAYDYYDRNPGKNTGNAKIFRTSGQVRAIESFGGKIYAACGSGGIRVYDEKTMNFEYAVLTGGVVFDVRIASGKLYAALGRDGLKIYEIGERLKEAASYYKGSKNLMQAVPSKNGKFVMAHFGGQSMEILDTSDYDNIHTVSDEYDNPGLMYYRQITTDPVMGKYHACFWNTNYLHLFDLSGDKMVRKECDIIGPGFINGITGCDDFDKMIITDGEGYIIADLKNSECEKITVPGVKIYGKPKIYKNIMVVSERIEGDVFIIDISDIHKPELIEKYNFAGNPDIACIIENKIYIPLGHQGIGIIEY